jgi:hypothetical protein
MATIYNSRMEATLATQVTLYTVHRMDIATKCKDPRLETLLSPNKLPQQSEIKVILSVEEDAKALDTIQK